MIGRSRDDGSNDEAHLEEANLDGASRGLRAARLDEDRPRRERGAEGGEHRPAGRAAAVEDRAEHRHRAGARTNDEARVNDFVSMPRSRSRLALSVFHGSVALIGSCDEKHPFNFFIGKSPIDS